MAHRSRRIFITLFAVFVLAVFSANGWSKQYSGIKAEIETLVESGKYAPAMEKLIVLEKMGNPDADFYFLRAKAEAGLGQFAKALPDAQKAVDLEPGFVEAIGHLGIVEMNLGKADQAIKTITRALNLRVEADLYYARGAAFMALGDLDASLEDLDNAIVLASDREDLLIARGEVLMRMKRLNEAERDYGKAIEINPKSASAYLGRGGLYIITRKKVEARLDLDHAIAIDPQNGMAFLRRGKYWEMVDNQENALDDYRHATDYLPTSDEAWFERTTMEMQLGRFEQAEESAGKLLQFTRNRTGANKLMGLVLTSRGKWEQAEKAYDKAISQNPKDAEAYFLRGSTRAADGKADLAIADFDKAISLLPPYLDPYLAKANVFISQNKPEKALDIYNVLLADDPDNPFVLRYRSDLYKTMGRYDDSLADLDKLKKITEKNAQ